jgi:ABC-2 type transport system permease protein
VAPVPRIYIMAGRTLGGAIVALLQGSVMTVFCLIAGFRITHPESLPGALLFMVLIAVMFTALGTALASVLSDFQAFQLVMNLLIMPLFFLSGALFPLDFVSSTMAIVAKLNPLTYGVDGVRGSLIGVWHFSAVHDAGVLAVIVVVLVSLGTFLFSRIQL